MANVHSPDAQIILRRISIDEAKQNVCFNIPFRTTTNNSKHIFAITSAIDAYVQMTYFQYISSVPLLATDLFAHFFRFLVPCLSYFDGMLR